MALVQLIYVSHSSEVLDTAELDRILESSVRHNGPQEVTGMLLYANGSFMQVLEGEQAAIDETFNRISEDPRHTGIVVLDRGPITERSFEHWNMGFRRLGPQDAEAHPAYARFFRDGFDAGAIGAHPGMALELLTNFSQRN